VFVAFSRGGEILASGGLGRKIKLWDAATGKGIAILNGYSRDASCLAFSPDGKTLAMGTDSEENVARLWDVTAIREKKK
jgi:eukaryotic-like serine/threonine-protein kinase